MRQRLRLNGVRLLIRTRLWAQILAGMTLGVLVGLALSPSAGGPFAVSPDLAGDVGAWLRLPGAIFLNLIQMVVIPLIATSIILGLTSAGDPEFLRRVAVRITPYFVGTTTLAVLIGAALAYTIDPGSFVDLEALQPGAAAAVDLSQVQAAQDVSLADRISALVPSNLAEATLYQNMIQIVVATIIGGVAIAAIGRSRMQPLLTLIAQVQSVALKVVGWAMLLAPVAVFGLIADFMLRVGVSALVGMSIYILTVLIGLALLIVVYLIIVALLGRRSPFAFLTQVFDAQILAFSTSSSAATMPLSLQIAVNRLKTARPVANFIVPLGATVNMDGTALYQVIAALFVARIYGVDLAPETLALMMATVVGASIGSPSTPGVGIIILATILQSIGIPASGVAILLGVDRILDMCRTAVNVTGDLTACVVMDRWLADELAPPAVIEETPGADDQSNVSAGDSPQTM